MKHKLIALMAGGMMLATPFLTGIAQAKPALDQLPILSGVEFTEQQTNEFNQLRSQTRSQLERTITPEQRSQLFAALQSGKGIREAIAAMNLSPEQKTQLRQVFQSTRQQVSSTLTPQQKRQLMQNLRNQAMQSLR